MHNELHFCSVSKFNDPLDCEYRVEWRGSPGEKRKYVQRVHKIHGSSLNRHERRSRFSTGKRKLDDPAFQEKAQVINRREVESWGVSCLSEVPPHENFMWWDYADHHRGFCLEFSNELSMPFVVRRKPEDSDKKPESLAPYQVKYDDEYPVINCISDEPEAMAKKNHL